MPEGNPKNSTFIHKITAIIDQNIANEQFGVSELADALSMSRSNLLRKIKKETGLSVSQMIRQIRLQRGMELLRTSGFNISEVSDQVGFGSTSYFIKCFREHYGYPPGEVGKREEEPADIISSPSRRRNRSLMIIATVVGVAILVIAAMVAYRSLPSSEVREKSIAVLPFKNDSNDSTNVYLINGLMESTLNNLQKIKALRVVSRTSTEKYRSTPKSIPEMADELHVNYFVEGSGQKIGDRIVLNIQLIDAATDTHLWSKQYRRESNDIFELQQEVAKNIAMEIQAIITPKEQKNIEKQPTANLVAYDLFLKGRELFYQGTRENLEKSLSYFKKAIEQDNAFALAYANAAMVYFYLDIYQIEKKYDDEINAYAERAMSSDSTLSESLVAKALAFIHQQKYQQAVPYLEKALEYNPNSSLVLHFLSEFYYAHNPNTAKYLEYALMQARVEVAADSATQSITYLQLSNAFIQAGFIDQALDYVNRSLAYNPKNQISGFLKVYIEFARNRDLKQTKRRLIEELKKDTTQIPLLQEVGKVCYMINDYECAYKYYKKYIRLTEAQQLDIYPFENLKIGIVLSKMGLKKKSEEYIERFRSYIYNDQSIYKNINLATYYAYLKEPDKVIEHLRLFSREDNYTYWVLLLESEPLFDPFKGIPEFKQVVQDIQNNFWETHNAIRKNLEEKGLL